MLFKGRSEFLITFLSLIGNKNSFQSGLAPEVE